RQTLKTQPQSAAAKAGLANTFLFRFVLGDLSRDEAVPRAKVLLDEALQIDSGSALVCLSRSRFSCLGEWQWEKAQYEMERAWNFATDNETKSIASAWIGCYLVERGQTERGLELLRWANEISPLSPFVARLFAEANFLARQFSTCVTVS